MTKPSSDQPLRLAVLGMIPGNGHPYSWSAIINGYNREAMASCPYPAIPGYLGAQPSANVRIPGVNVTHVWTDNPTEAPAVAAASLIPHVVARPEDVIGEVDAVLVSTDDGADHVRRARPFVEAGLPVFIDKPMATTMDELKTFIAWERGGAPLLSSSGMRYAPELGKLAADLPSMGELRWLSLTTAKTWERYGIHVLEPAFVLLGPGFVSVRLESQPGLEVAHLLHRSGVQVSLPIIYDGGGSFGAVQLCGTKGLAQIRFTDTFNAFRNQLLAFINYVRTRRHPYPFAHTVEMMAVIIAGIRSRESGCQRVDLSEILSELSYETTS
ncbi:MAG: Gfo/Idh/MocA family oxidoreductase [Verrucomicrobia bacterium]|nr:Gfo/Idh/MocA family oxidoreductase [Verrucomicrobiota bacterium]